MLSLVFKHPAIMTPPPAPPSEEPPLDPIRNLSNIPGVWITFCLLVGILVFGMFYPLYCHFTKKHTKKVRRILRVFGIGCLGFTAVIISFFSVYLNDRESHTHGSKKLVASVDFVASIVAGFLYFTQWNGTRNWATGLCFVIGILLCALRFFGLILVCLKADEKPQSRLYIWSVLYAPVGWLISACGAYLPNLRDAFQDRDEDKE